MQKIPIGISDFKELITGNYLFVDKTLLIKALLDDGAKVTLFTRPRRFGKTLNLSMLHYFFSNTEQNTAELFNDLNIAKAGGEYMSHQGQYPTIFLSLKDIKTNSIEQAQQQIAGLLAQSYQTHAKLLDNEKMSAEDKRFFQTILDRTASLTELAESLQRLTFLLHQYCGQKVMVFIDEYDTPIQEGYLHGFYNEMAAFMRIFLGKGLKDNTCLQQAVITGILRVGKESIFSGLNHLEVYSLFGSRFGEFFGFTQPETDALFKTLRLQDKMADIEAWYNGYQMAGVTIYNPWSILNCIKNNGLKQPYWVNTASNALIEQLFRRSSIEVKEKLESLIQGRTIQVIISEHMIFNDLTNDDAAVWHLLLFAGYLKVLEQTFTAEYQLLCTLAVPNKEVASVYGVIMKNWFQPAMPSSSYHALVHYLITGKIEDFSFLFKKLIRQSFSFFDVTGEQPERVYHAFVLGLISQLQETYIIKSNRESGYGRYDVMLIPKDITKLGIIIEFKTQSIEKSLEQAAQAAMQQINEKHYDTELKQHGITHILKLAIAFTGKEVVILAA